MDCQSLHCLQITSTRGRNIQAQGWDDNDAYRLRSGISEYFDGLVQQSVHCGVFTRDIKPRKYLSYTQLQDSAVVQ